MKIIINGLGRIGKLVFRRLCDKGLYKNILLVNEKEGSPEDQEYFLKYDSVHGSWGDFLTYKNNFLYYKNHKISVSNFSSIDDIDFKGEKNVLVIDCTGKHNSLNLLNPYINKYAKYILVSAPIESKSVQNIVYGVNHNDVDTKNFQIFTSASCTTNCLAPIVKVLEEQIGIEHGSITTIHNITNSQNLVDSPKANLRRSRSGINSLIPTTDCVFEMKKPVTVEEINKLFIEASASYLKNILSFEERPLVSSDYVNNSHSAIIDGLSTMVVNRTQLKVYAWYDNEWGYACRMVDLISHIMNK